MPIHGGSNACACACPKPFPTDQMIARARKLTKVRALWGPSLAGFAAGFVAAAGQAPLGWWPLALVAFGVLFYLILNADTPRYGARLAWIGGGGYFAAALFWIVEPFLVDVARHGWMAPFALGLMSFGLALFWGGAAWVAGRQTDIRRRAILLAICLALAELARSYVFTGFPWALIGHLWIGTPVMQLAAFIGPIGLTFLTTLLISLPFAFRRFGIGVAAAVAVVAACWGGGLWRLSQPVADRDTPVHIRLLQPNAPQHLKWRPDMVPVFFDRQLEFSTAPSDPGLALIVWPETAVPYLLERAQGALDVMSDAAGGVPVLFGVQRRDFGGVYNSLGVIDGVGTVTHSYDKFHLVPFGEYMPFSALFSRLGIAGLAANDIRGYTRGPGARVLDLGVAGKVQPLICYEAVFPQDLRGATERADWVLHITNDAWFGKITGPYQHLAQTRLRAVEQGLPVLRSANTGVSAVIDAHGRVLDHLPLNTAGFLDVSVPGAMVPTLYSRTGDWPMLVLLIVAGLPLLRRKTPKPD